MLGKYVPQDTEASATRYIRPVGLRARASKREGGIKKTVKPKSKLFGFSSLGCTTSTSGTACATVGDGHRMQETCQLSFLALSLHVWKRALGFLRFALHDLNMSSVCFSPECLICDRPPLSSVVFLPSCLRSSDSWYKQPPWRFLLPLTHHFLAQKSSNISTHSRFQQIS